MRGLKQVGKLVGWSKGELESGPSKVVSALFHHNDSYRIQWNSNTNHTLTCGLWASQTLVFISPPPQTKPLSIFSASLPPCLSSFHVSPHSPNPPPPPQLAHDPSFCSSYLLALLIKSVVGACLLCHTWLS